MILVPSLKHVYFIMIDARKFRLLKRCLAPAIGCVIETTACKIFLSYDKSGGGWSDGGSILPCCVTVNSRVVRLSLAETSNIEVLFWHDGDSARKPPSAFASLHGGK